MKNSSSKQEKPMGGRHVLQPVLWSCGAGVLLSALLLFFFAWALTLQDFPHGVIEPMALTASAAGAFAAGFLCAGLCRERGLLLGALCGLLVFVLILLSGTVISGVSFGLPAFLRLIVLTLFGAFGGVLGVNTRLKRK